MNISDMTPVPTDEDFSTAATETASYDNGIVNVPDVTTEADYAIGWSSDQQSLENQLSIRVIYGAISVLGIMGNSLVIFTVLRVEKMQTKTNVFIVSLACCDLITSVFLIPLHLGKWFTLTNLPHKVKTQYVHYRSHIEYFLLPWKISEKISRRSELNYRPKGSIYYIKRMYVQPFRMEVD